MGKRISNTLLVVNLLTFVLILVTYFYPHNILRIILGIPFLLFAPGYTLVGALFPHRKNMSGRERVALSLGLSIAVVPLIGLILNYTPWGIRLETVLFSVAIFVFLTSVIALVRLMAWAGQEMPEQEPSEVQSRLRMSGRGNGFWDRALTIIMVIVIIGALGTMVRFIVTPKVAEPFTQFYILGPQGNGVNYPRELRVGETGTVTVGIVNNEGDNVNYRVQVLINGNKSDEMGQIALADGLKWQGDISFVPTSAGQNEKVEFLLYKNGGSQPYLEPLYLWVNVSG